MIWSQCATCSAWPLNSLAYLVRSDAHRVSISSIVRFLRRDWAGATGPTVEAPIVEVPKVGATEPPKAGFAAPVVVMAFVDGAVALVVVDAPRANPAKGAEVVAADGAEVAAVVDAGPKPLNAGGCVGAGAPACEAVVVF